MSMKTISEAEWRAEGTGLFGTDMMAWRFACPSCGHIATPRDWQKAGAPESAIGFSCVGRWIDDDQVSSRAFRKAGGPCNYTGGGLFKLNPVTVVFTDGQQASMFAFAESEQVPA